MNLIVVTGVSGSGKTTFCRIQNKPTLHYDDMFNYMTLTFDREKIKSFFDLNINSAEIYLDAFNNKYLEYIKTIVNPIKTQCILLYTDIDELYNIISRDINRDFNCETYDHYCQSIIDEIRMILDIAANNRQLSDDVVYYHRNKKQYSVYTTHDHLNSLLNQTKQDRLLSFIHQVSGSPLYQSIILDTRVIQTGTEGDNITFEKILACTQLKDKYIMDMACFNGYFSFRSLEYSPKKILGIDHNDAAISICEKICDYNNYHRWRLSTMKDSSCEKGISFKLCKIGVDEIFSERVDLIYALNFLHHLKCELGTGIFCDVIGSFFKNADEIIFEVNDVEVPIIEEIGKKHNFILSTRIESHRKTSFGNRWILHYTITSA